MAEERAAGIRAFESYFAAQEEVEGAVQRIVHEVQHMVEDKTALRKFDGKAILGAFYNEIVSGKGIGMSFEVFCYNIAERIGQNGRTPESLKMALNTIKEGLKTYTTPDQH